MVDLLTSQSLRRAAACLCVLVIIISARDAVSQTIPSGNGYYPYTIARSQDREWIRSLPMEQRPNRPLHFYGNTVRRQSVQRPSYIVQPKRIANPALSLRPGLKRFR